MAVLNVQEIEYEWIRAGGDPGKAAMAASIALAESGGDTAAVNHNTNGTTDLGLWQINSVHGTQSTTDMLANAKAAVAISNNGADWSPWTTYTSGAYKQFVTDANKVAGAVTKAYQTFNAPPGTSDPGLGIPGLDQVAGGITSGLNTVSGVVTAPLKGIEAVGAFFDLLTNPKTWLTILKFGAGAVAIYLAIKSLSGVQTPSVAAAAMKVAK